MFTILKVTDSILAQNMTPNSAMAVAFYMATHENCTVFSDRLVFDDTVYNFCDSSKEWFNAPSVQNFKLDLLKKSVEVTDVE